MYSDGSRPPVKKGNVAKLSLGKKTATEIKNFYKETFIMNKIKKFLHMMVAFAFAFVLAIGGIGIKSAKASVTTDAAVF